MTIYFAKNLPLGPVLVGWLVSATPGFNLGSSNEAGPSSFWMAHSRGRHAVAGLAGGSAEAVARGPWFLSLWPLQGCWDFPTAQ